MKKILFLWSLLITSAVTYAQNMRNVYLPAHGTIHFLSPEPIQYIDISTRSITGDLPLKNLARLKYRDSITFPQPATVTIVGQRFITQYHIVPGENGASQIEILPGDMRPLDISGVDFSESELRSMATRLFSRQPDKKVATSKAFGLKARVNHIYTAGDHIFLDISFRNKTQLQYSIDGLRFRIEDKKVTKAANNQAVEIKPELALFSVSKFSKEYRNVFVFRKVTFPGNKRLALEISEKPVSGRVLTLYITYQDILDADITTQ